MNAEERKVEAQTRLIEAQVVELTRNSKIIKHLSQGLGVGIIVGAGLFALYGPIKDVIEAESNVAEAQNDLNAKKLELYKIEMSELEGQAKITRESLAEANRAMANIRKQRDGVVQENRELLDKQIVLEETYKALAEKYEADLDLRSLATEAKKRTDEITNSLLKSLDTVKKQADLDAERLSLFQDYSEIQFTKEAIGTTRLIAEYQIELINVGDYDENIDVVISNNESARTRLSNLKSGRRYVASFNEHLFLIYVEEVFQSRAVKSQEKATFSVGLLSIEALVVD